LTPRAASLARPGWRILQVAIAALLLAVLWHAADGREAMRLLARAEPAWLLAAVAALSVQTVLSALRWRLTAGRLGIAMGRRMAVREYYLSQVLNQSLPGGMVGDASRAVRSRAQAGLVKAGQAVILERLTGQVAMFLVLAAGFFVTWLAPGGLVWPRWLAMPVAVAIGCALAAPAILVFAARLPGAIGRALTGFGDAVGAAIMAHDVLARQIALSLGTAFCNLAAFAFCAAALGIALPLAAIVTILPLALFTMLVPITVSGWGLREGAASALFPIAGATAAQGFATSVAFGLAFIVAVLPGVVPLLIGRKREPAARET
jgi:uncharacterized membrane protein YbhN (UPF0104 family)